MLKDLILSFKFFTTTRGESITDKNYCNNVCKKIEKQIVNYDPSFKTQSYYGEYETEIKRCTITLLKLLFFENEKLADMIQMILFNTIICWIDFVKSEIINYIHVERGKDYGLYFSKLVQYHKKNKSKFVTANR
ncbi:hypothetical protein JTB14_027080 [Gonioctena quinquepunctata]|nr:hypothetical protein JTB14_027080 [Gonioctena quinquepunctata]